LGPSRLIRPAAVLAIAVMLLSLGAAGAATDPVASSSGGPDGGPVALQVGTFPPASEPARERVEPRFGIESPVGDVERLWAMSSSGWTANEEYVGGTYVWTDQVLDDAGAGAYTYPDGPSYMANAADLVEIRVAADGDGGLVLGARLNTLLDEGIPAVAIGITGPAAPAQPEVWPGAGVTAEDVRWVVTLDGRVDGGSTLTDLADGRVVALGPADVRNETARPQRALENTLTTVVTPAQLGVNSIPTRFGIHAVAGVREPDADEWYRPSDTTTPPAYDVAFFTGDTGENFGDWERAKQAELLAAGDITAARRTVDLSISDRPAVPKAGQAQSRIYRMSIQEKLGEGIAPYEIPLVKGAEEQTTIAQGNRYLGLFQPYTVWVPRGYPSLPKPLSLFVSLHGLGGNHYDTVSEWTSGAISVPALAVFPLGHAPSGFYQEAGELDVLESLEDARSVLPVDDDRVYLTGISMGGSGTYTVGTHHPDLFAGAVPIVGPGAGTREFLYPAPVEPVMGEVRDDVQIYRMGSFGREVLDNALNLPYRIFAAVLDPLTTVTFSEGDAARWEELGYDYQYGLFPRRTHEFFTPYVNTLYHQLLDGCTVGEVPGCDRSLDPPVGRVRDENPARVVYKAVPFQWRDELSDKLRFDGAYWVDGMVPRKAELADDYARIDVSSRRLAAKRRAQVQEWGTTAPEVRTFGPTGEPYKFKGRGWAVVAAEVSNGFDAVLHNLDAVTLDVGRMALSTAEPIVMTATGDGTTIVTLADGGWSDGTVVEVRRGGEAVASATASGGAVSLAVPFETPARGGGAPQYVITAGAAPVTGPAPVTPPRGGTLPATGGDELRALLALTLFGAAGLVLRRRRR
jgi:dienelactone hydrolase